MSVSSGHVYERGAIDLWLQDHDTDPLTGMRLENKSLAPQHILRNVRAPLFFFEFGEWMFNPLRADGREGARACTGGARGCQGVLCRWRSFLKGYKVFATSW